MINNKILKDNLFNIILLVLVVIGGVRLLIVNSTPKKISFTNNNVAAEVGANPIVDTAAKKTDKPLVELFVMSHCPFGTQIEKGILPVAKTLGDKIDFQIKFTDYAMHGETELREQLAQYCIQKEQPEKFFAYLEAFLVEGDSDSSLEQSGVNKDKLLSCIDKTDKEFKVLENFNKKIGFKGTYPGFEIFKADNAKYNVAGSPTLVINGTQNESGRDSNSLLKSICSAFNNAPEECDLELSAATPAPGFGTEVQSGAASANSGCH